MGTPTTPEDRLAADVFGMTYREYSASREEDYRLRLIAPEAVRQLRLAEAERWSAEKLADYLHTDVEDASLRLRRFKMSDRVNSGQHTPERISRLFTEWLRRFDLDEGSRKELSRDLSRLLSSQLHRAAEKGETLADVIGELEKAEGGMGAGSGDKPNPREEGPRPWGPQWKD